MRKILFTTQKKNVTWVQEKFKIQQQQHKKYNPKTVLKVR